MEVKVLSEYGYKEAGFGLLLSYGRTSGVDFEEFTDIEAAEKVMRRLAGKGNGHDKFLRMIVVTLDITAPLYWWSEFDTYKVGTTAQSESKMHTFGKRDLQPTDLEPAIYHDPHGLDYVNHHLRRHREAKAEGHAGSAEFFWRYALEALPLCFLQRRIVQCNYAVLANIIRQRRGHRLPQWRTFINAVVSGVQHPELLLDDKLDDKKEE